MMHVYRSHWALLDGIRTLPVIHIRFMAKEVLRRPVLLFHLLDEGDAVRRGDQRDYAFYPGTRCNMVVFSGLYGRLHRAKARRSLQR